MKYFQRETHTPRHKHKHITLHRDTTLKKHKFTTTNSIKLYNHIFKSHKTPETQSLLPSKINSESLFKAQKCTTARRQVTKNNNNKNTKRKKLKKKRNSQKRNDQETETEQNYKKIHFKY